MHGNSAGDLFGMVKLVFCDPFKWFSDLLKCLSKCDSQVIQFVTKNHPRSLGWSPNQPFKFGSRKFTISKRSPAELPGVALLCFPKKKEGGLRTIKQEFGLPLPQKTQNFPIIFCGCV